MSTWPELIHPDADLVDRLRLTAIEGLSAVLQRRCPVALLDFPNHSNVGDSAIWLGELEIIKTMGLRSPVYVCDHATYDPQRLRAQLREGTILLSGGGNLGDLWPVHQTFRERVLTDFPDLPVIQLPQSVFFGSKDNLRRARRVFESHPCFTLMVRERASLAFAQRNFSVPCVLCPDMAFGLGVLQRPVRPDSTVVWLSRTDQEKKHGRSTPTPVAGAERQDWLTDDEGTLVRLYRGLERSRSDHPHVLRWLRPSVLHASVASRRLRRGLLMLSRGSVVVTDRLHGHILALLLGIRHFVTDNSYGKVSAFVETWTRDSSLATLCESEDSALAAAQHYVESSVGIELGA